MITAVVVSMMRDTQFDLADGLLCHEESATPVKILHLP